MSRLFDMDNPFFRTLGKLADLMILNLLFILCSIPIVTIGASFTGMYYVTLKIAENEEGYIAKSFFKSFKQNFRQATIIWLIALVLGIVFGLDLFILAHAEGTVFDVVRIAITAVMILYLITLIYVFPTLARFYNTIRGTVKNAFLMSIANLPRTFLALVLTVGSVLLTFLNGYTLVYGTLVWILAGFSLIAFANSILIKKIFAKYSPKEPETDPDAWDADAAEADILDDPDRKKALEDSTENPQA